MEMYKVAAYLIILNFGFAWVSAMGLVGTSYPNELSKRINEDLISDRLGSGEGGAWFGEEIIDYVSYIADSVFLFFAVLYDTTMGLPKMLANEPFDFPDIIVNTIIAFQIVIYGVGIISFLRGFAL